MSIKSKFYIKWGTNIIRDNAPDISIGVNKLQTLELALGMFNKAIKADPRDLDAYVDRFIVLEQMGRREEALKTLDQAIEENPEKEGLISKFKHKAINYINDNKEHKI